MKPLGSLAVVLFACLVVALPAFSDSQPEAKKSKSNKPEHGGAFISSNNFTFEFLAKNGSVDRVEFTAYVNNPEGVAEPKGTLTLLIIEGDGKSLSVPLSPGVDGAFHGQSMLVHRPRYRLRFSFKPVGEPIIEGGLSLKAEGAVGHARGHK